MMPAARSAFISSASASGTPAPRKGLSPPPDELEVVVHRNCSFRRLILSRIRSISCVGIGRCGSRSSSIHPVRAPPSAPNRYPLTAKRTPRTGGQRRRRPGAHPDAPLTGQRRKHAPEAIRGRRPQRRESEAAPSAVAGDVVEDLEGGAHPFRGAAFHEALEILRAMLAGEVDGTGARLRSRRRPCTGRPSNRNRNSAGRDRASGPRAWRGRSTRLKCPGTRSRTGAGRRGRRPPPWGWRRRASTATTPRRHPRCRRRCS